MTSEQLFGLILPSLICLFSLALFQRWRKRPPTPYPPTPKPKFIIGNALDIPFTQLPWLKYIEWSKRLNSDIVHMSAMNKHIVVLHKMEDAVSLMEKRSATYSDRPTIPVFEVLDVNFATSALPYGEKWRQHRKIYQECLRKGCIPSYHHIMTEKVKLWLSELLRDPENFAEHSQWLAASFTLAMGFSYDIPPGRKNDPVIEAAAFSATTAVELVLPGRTMINLLPFLKHIPPWVPGAYTQRLAAKTRQMVTVFKSVPFEYAMKNMIAGALGDCIFRDLLRQREKQPSGSYDDETLKDVMATLYFGGVETFQSTVLTMIFALALHPDVQREAQEEIDQVVGMDRMPTFEDRISLPYVEALLREIRRWRPIAPLGFPHATSKVDIYKGFYIPKGAFVHLRTSPTLNLITIGTLVMPNVWAFTRDKTKYPDPERFSPERFFNSDGTLNDDDVGYTFGFGRRICPGRHLADSLSWLTLASVLSIFDISKAKDENGHEIDIDPNGMMDSVATHPLPFKCSIAARSKQAEIIIKKATK